MYEQMNKALKEIEHEMADKILINEQKGKMFNQKLLILQQKFLDLAKIKCKENLKWFLKEGSPTSTVKGVEFRVSKYRIKESEKHFNDLSNCLSKYENGIKQETLMSQKNLELVSINHNKCLNDCENGNPTELKIKRCFKACINDSLEKTQKIHNEMERKIDDTLFRINKLLV